MSAFTSSAASQSVEPSNTPSSNHKHFFSPSESKTTTHEPVRYKWLSSSTSFYMPVSALKREEIRHTTKARTELKNAQVLTSSTDLMPCPISPLKTEQCSSV